MENIRQCWAFNRDGVRCEHPAGHPGKHVVMSEWDDSECFAPIRHQLPEPKQLTPTLTETVTTQPTKCIACGHQHKGGECKCGCYEFIG